jgi:Ni,Fe-hydrogenase I cytochrome b subunit
MVPELSFIKLYMLCSSRVEHDQQNNPINSFSKLQYYEVTLGLFCPTPKLYIPYELMIAYESSS